MIRVENLRIDVGSYSLNSLSFEVPAGQYAVLMGRTGCGKTTLMETLCGLRKVAAGRVWLCDRDVTHLKPAERGIGFVPQDGALFETMSVRDQLGFALMVRKWNRKSIDRRVEELAELLGIGHLLNRKPEGLSGGERQRVALGRSLAPHPRILCLDEPLSALDDATRDEMYNLLESVRRVVGVTTLHITHNRAEAVRLANVVLLLVDGMIRVVRPQDLEHDFPSPACPESHPRQSAFK